MANSGGVEILKSNAASFCAHHVRVPLPLLILKIGILLALVALSAFFIFHWADNKAQVDWLPPPMILIPGLSMSELYVDGFDIKYPEELSAYNCPRNIPLRKSWVSKELGDNPKCEVYLLQQLDSEFKNMPNVRVTAGPPGVRFGSSLDSIHGDEDDDSYFGPLVEFLMARYKYQLGKTLFATPYDWRQDQQSDVMEEYYDNLQSLIERTFNRTNRRVFLLGHSMGNLVMNRFLRRDKITSEWQKRHLQATINVASPYGGITRVMRTMYSGLTMAGGKLSPALAKKMVRKMSFPANLLAYKNAFGGETLFSIKDEKYSPDGMVDFLAKVGMGNLAKLHAKNEPQPQLHTPMHCVYSVGVNNTEYKYAYSTDSETSEPQIEYADGDHIIPVQSLRVCQQWKRDGHPVEVKELANWEHNEILAKPDFLDYIAEVIEDV